MDKHIMPSTIPGVYFDLNYLLVALKSKFIKETGSKCNFYEVVKNGQKLVYETQMPNSKKEELTKDKSLVDLYSSIISLENYLR